MNIEHRTSNDSGCRAFGVQRSMFGVRFFVFLAALGSAAVFGAEPTRVELDFFENKIRPILADNCFKCHSPAKGKVKAGLELDWKGGWEKGGDNGPAIVPGSPEKSLLIKAVQ